MTTYYECSTCGRSCSAMDSPCAYCAVVNNTMTTDKQELIDGIRNLSAGITAREAIGRLNSPYGKGWTNGFAEAKERCAELVEKALSGSWVSDGEPYIPEKLTTGQNYWAEERRKASSPAPTHQPALPTRDLLDEITREWAETLPFNVREHLKQKHVSKLHDLTLRRLSGDQP